MTSGTIAINVSIKSAVEQITAKMSHEDFKITPEYFRALHNWKNSRGKAYNWRGVFVDGSNVDGLGEVTAAFNDSVLQSIGEAIKAAVIKNGGEWQE